MACPASSARAASRSVSSDRLSSSPGSDITELNVRALLFFYADTVRNKEKSAFSETWQAFYRQEC